MIILTHAMETLFLYLHILFMDIHGMNLHKRRSLCTSKLNILVLILSKLIGDKLVHTISDKYVAHFCINFVSINTALTSTGLHGKWQKYYLWNRPKSYSFTNAAVTFQPWECISSHCSYINSKLKYLHMLDMQYRKQCNVDAQSDLIYGYYLEHL